MVRRGDDDAVDVLVLEDAPHVLHEVRLERRHVLQPRVVDALGREVRVDVAERLDLDVLQLGEAALERVALPADADAGERRRCRWRRGSRACVAADVAASGPEEFTADGEPRRRRAEARRESRAATMPFWSFRSLATESSCQTWWILTRRPDSGQRPPRYSARPATATVRPRSDSAASPRRSAGTRLQAPRFPGARPSPTRSSSSPVAGLDQHVDGFLHRHRAGAGEDVANAGAFRA